MQLQWALGAAVGRAARRFQGATHFASLEVLVGPAVSLAAHTALFIMLAFSFFGAPLRPPAPVESMSVEVLSSGQFAALRAPRPLSVPLPPVPLSPAPRPPTVEPLTDAPLIHATTIFSDAALTGESRRALATVAYDARFEQICGVEAMEQIAKGASFRPERVVAYALSDTKTEGNVMVAGGAAFWSDGAWYRLSFRCETSSDRLKVKAFDFATGARVTAGRGLSASPAAD